ncbi:MAG: hypothetical protein V4592_07150 [Bacteroidota bacterium]
MKSACRWLGLFIFLSACSHPKPVPGKAKAAAHHSKITSATTPDHSNDILSTDLYIIKRGGTVTYTNPDTTGNDPYTGNLAFGTRMMLMSKSKGWLRVRKFDCYNCSEWFIPQSVAGPASSLIFNTSELNKLYYDEALTDTNDAQLPDTSRLTEFKLDLVSEQEFRAQQHNAINHFTADTGAFSKKKGVLTIKTTKKIIRLKDVANGEKEESYAYLGRYAALHKLVIAGGYNEWSNMFFIDELSGKTIGTEFLNMPYVSPGMRYAVTVSTDDGDDCGDINLYALKPDTVIHIAGNHFQYWMPALESHLFFWTADRCFYFALMPYGAYSDNPGQGMAERPNSQLQYARIHFTRKID